MALIQAYEKSGNFLFKYRGQIPVLIMVLAIPILLFTHREGYAELYACPTHWLRIATAVVAVSVTLCGLVLRAYTVSTTPKGTSGRNTQKQVAKQLNTKGIYSVVRHPLYLANYLIWAGILIFTMNVWAYIIVSLLYWIYYERIMFAEEAYLRQQFGEEFEVWAMQVPAFIPNFSLFQKGDMQFSFKTFLRREYATVFSAVFCYWLVDYLLYGYILFLNDACSSANWLRPSGMVMLLFFVVMLILRTLKHHTNILRSDNTRD